MFSRLYRQSALKYVLLTPVGFGEILKPNFTLISFVQLFSGKLLRPALLLHCQVPVSGGLQEGHPQCGEILSCGRGLGEDGGIFEERA